MLKQVMVVCFVGFALFFVQAQTNPAQLIQQSARRQAKINAQLAPLPDGHLPMDIKQALHPRADKQLSCFPIRALSLTSVTGQPLQKRFLRYLGHTLESEDIGAKQLEKQRFQLMGNKGKAPCFSSEKVKSISSKLQNSLIAHGLITSRVLIPEQNLHRGVLILSIAVGRVGKLTVDKVNWAKTHANRATLYNAFPTRKRRLLNLRDLEQGLENLRRLPTVSAQMDIKPGKVLNSSNIVVHWQQKAVPLRLNLSVDDSGSPSTGKYLGTTSLAWDNPLKLNDMFSISYTKNLSSGTKKTDPHGKSDKGNTDNYAINYSIPAGYWQFDIGMSHYHYDQVVAGLNRNYHYNGESTRSHIGLSKVLYRDSQHKISVNAGLWRKTSHSFVDDSEIEVQRRHTGGWQIGLSQRSYFSLGTLSTSLTYKRGTRAFGAISAPEETFAEGTGKMKIWTTDIDWQMPFQWRKQSFLWASHFHGQKHGTLLTSQDRIAIGGRYSVRGFSGERTLSGDSGWYWRNDLSWRYHPQHQLYIGLDNGHVSGYSARNLLGHTLGGLVIGLKGRFAGYGQWHYDLFAGRAIKEPKGFHADTTVLGFSFSASF